MKVALVLGQEKLPNPRAGGGVVTLVHALAEGFADQGNRVTVVSANERPLDAPPAVEYMQIPGITRHPSPAINFIAGLPYAIASMRRLRGFDVISCHNLHSFLFGFSRRDCVVTHTIHRAAKPYMRIYGRLDRVYAGTPSIIDEVGRLSPRLGEKGRCVPNFVDFKGRGPADNIAAESVQFMYVGRLTRDKGLESLLRGFILACANCPTRIELKMLGPQRSEEGADPKFVRELQAIAETSGFADRIFFEGPIYDKALLELAISRANVACLPSLGGETLNMTMIECMRLSKPLLVSDIPANAPLVKEGAGGYFVKAGSPGSWCERIRRIASDRQRLVEMGFSSYRHGLTNFSKDVVVSQYLDDFRSLLSRKQASSLVGSRL